jgi:hypothetical protein
MPLPWDLDYKTPSLTMPMAGEGFTVSAPMAGQPP